MRLLEERIRKDGVIKGNEVLKVPESSDGRGAFYGDWKGIPALV